MVRRPLPPPPPDNSSGSQDPTESIYEEGAESSPPPTVIPRGARHLPPPPPAEWQASEELYDDFDSAGSGEGPQETYDDFDVAPTTRSAPPAADDEELYDEMSEAPSHLGGGRAPMTGAGKAPPLPPGKRAPLPAPPAERVGSESEDEELYDEMSEVPQLGATKPPPLGGARPLMTGAVKPPPLPPTKRAPAPAPDEDSSEEYDTWEEAKDHRPTVARSESPEDYVNPDEIEDDGELYQDPNEGNEVFQDVFVPPAPPIPGESSKGRIPISPPVQDTYEIEPGHPAPPPAPTVPLPPLSRPALPERSGGGPKKGIVLPPKVAGFDPSQVLKVKLNKVSGQQTPAKKSTSDEPQVSDFRNILRKTPAGDGNRPPVQPLQPPQTALKPKKAQWEEDPPKAPGAVPVKAKPPIQARQEKPVTKAPESPVMKVLVSPPPVSMNSHPKMVKTGAPEPSDLKPVAISPPPPTAVVKPERQLPPIPNGETITEQDPMEKYLWYHGMISREETVNRLRSETGEGVFLVRKSRQGSSSQPYTLVILYEGNIFNLKIRCRPEDEKIALGEEKQGEMAFSSVPSLVSYHRDHNVILIGNPGGQTKLNKHPPRP